MKKVNKDRINCLSMLDNMKSVLGKESYGEYVERIMRNIWEEEAIRNDLQNQIENIQETTQCFLKQNAGMANSLSAIAMVCTIIKKSFSILKTGYKDGHFPL